MTINIWIIWTWSIADVSHVPAISELKDCKLIAVLSRNEKRGRNFLNKHNVVNGIIYTSLEDFVNDKSIDLVIICSPDWLHSEQAISCLNNGKHVLLEKPMATNLYDSEKLTNLAKSKNLILIIGFHLRFHNWHNILYNKAIKNKEIWDLVHIRVIWAFPQKDNSNWRANDKLSKWWSLSAVGSHCLDLSRWFSDNFDDWKKFSSIISKNKWNWPNDESAIIWWELSSWVTVEVTSSVNFWPYNKLELFWTNWYAICNDTFWREGKGELFINGIKVDFKYENPFVNQIKYIISLIESKNNYQEYHKIWIRNVKDLLLSDNNK